MSAKVNKPYGEINLEKEENRSYLISSVGIDRLLVTVRDDEDDSHKYIELYGFSHSLRNAVSIALNEKQAAKLSRILKKLADKLKEEEANRE